MVIYRAIITILVLTDIMITYNILLRREPTNHSPPPTTTIHHAPPIHVFMRPAMLGDRGSK